MKLLKQSILFSFVAALMVTSVFAEVENQRLVDPTKATNEYAQSLIEKEKAEYYESGNTPDPIVREVNYTPGFRSTEVTREYVPGSWSTENSWEVMDANSNIVDSGAGGDGTPTVLLSLEDGDFTVYLYDSYGDGWNGGIISFYDPDGNVLGQGTIDSGAEGSFMFTVGGDIPVYGCTDPDAINYDESANTDDGSCFYNGDVCEYPLEGAVGLNAHDGGEGWYSFTIPEAGILTVSYPEYEMIQAIGTCGLDEYDSFIDFIGYGYQDFEQLFHATGLDYYGESTEGRIGSTIHIRIAGWYTVDPAEFNIGWTAAVEGCTDPQASNYSPDANIDDGSCEYAECDSNDLTMSMIDSYGDGWNGNVYLINDLGTGDLIAEGGLESGSEGADALCLNDGSYSIVVDYGSFQSEVSWSLDYTDGSGNVASGGAPYDGLFTLGDNVEVFGCTDSEALNYDPDATVDDGSCVYDYGMLCEFPLTVDVNGDAATGATTEPGDYRWYSFDVDDDYDNLTVSLCGSGFDTKMEIWNGCDNFLIENDDFCGLQSEFTLAPVTPGTGWVKLFGYGSSFGDYVLTVTAFNNPEQPTLSAEGVPGGVSLSWEPVTTNALNTAPTNTDIIDSYGTNPTKGEEPDVRHAPGFYNVSTNIVDTGNNLRDTDLTINMQDSYGDGWNGNVLVIGENSFTLETGTDGTANLSLADGVYDVSCDGGSWQSEVSWQIVDTNSGEELLSGGAPYTGILELGETGEVLGCTDMNALNYGFNCEGMSVGEPTIDDGCCEYPAPPNDLCEEAEAVSGPYPTTVSGTLSSATEDCPDLLNWPAVWYDIDLPYDNNVLEITMCSETGLGSVGVIVMDDCACDDYLVSSYIFDGNCVSHTWHISDGSDSMLFPAHNTLGGDFTLDINVEELYIPTFNVFRFGESIAEGVTGVSYFDGDVEPDVESCYTVSQMLPSGEESGHSNEACASSIAGIEGDTMDDPFVVGTIPFTTYGTTVGFYDNYDEECPYAGSTSPDVVYRYDATEDLSVDISLCGEGTYYDTKVYVYENDASVLAGCNDDECNNSHTSWLSSLSVDLLAGNTYYIVVDGYGGNMGDYELTVGVEGMCADDVFEDDDTKDQATFHEIPSTNSYSLCSDDNAGGIEQPAGVAAIDWSAVAMDPWTKLTALTFGDPPNANDIDLFIEDYDGDGICQWGGGDDLAGSGATFTEENAEYSNLTDDVVTVYVGVIYYAGDDPINYGLTLVVSDLDCPECPQNLTATPLAESIDLAWDPPYVSPGGRSGEFGDMGTASNRQYSIDRPGSKKALNQSKDELKISGLHPYAHGNPAALEAYNNEKKFQQIMSSGRNSVASSHAELQELIAQSRAQTVDQDVRADLYVQMYDSWGDGWNGNQLCMGGGYDQYCYTIETGDYAEAYLSLDEGSHSVSCDGGLYQSEVSWTISDVETGEVLLEGGAPYSGTLELDGDEPPPPPECYATEVIISCDGGSWQSEVSWTMNGEDGSSFSGGAPYTSEECLEDGNYDVTGVDSYGDGWNGNYLTVTGTDGTVYLNWTLESGTDGSTSFEVGGAVEVFGCTDPDAENYDPDATVDDGSCVYEGQVCEYSLPASAGSNDASGESQWFHYSASADGSITISSQNETEDAAWNTYLYALGSCETNEEGYYIDVITSNDDCCGYEGPSTVEFNVTAGQDVYLYWYNAYASGPFTFTIEEGEIVEECVDDEYENNDGSGTSWDIDPGTYDLVHCSGDPDWFQITVNNGQGLRLVVTEGDVDVSGNMDVGIWVFELDESYTQVYSPNLTEHDVTWTNNSDHPMVANFAVGDFWDGAFEGTYTMVVELVDFVQTTYTVYRDGAAIASDMLLTGFEDSDIVENVEYCYEVTASASGVESPPSTPACAMVEYVEPPDAPSNVVAEGGWLNVDGADYPAITWSWDYDFPEPGGTVVNVDIMTDNYGSETSWDIADADGNIVADGAGYESSTLYSVPVELEDGDYTFTIYDAYGDGICCTYGEGYYMLSLDDGTIIASGGEFADMESITFSLPYGGRDESISQFNINDGSFEFEHGLREIIFELCFEFGGTDYCFQTVETSISIYGFGDGDYVCGWVHAIDGGIYSDPSEEACAAAGGSSTVDVTVDHLAGWNMVSLAVGTDASGVGDLFPGHIEGTLYEYPYVAVDALNNGQGYWLRFESDGSDTQTGDPVDDLGISLSAGWNLIGSVSQDAGIDDPDGVVIEGTLYGYPYSNPVNAVTPGQGYWLRASADGMVYLSSGAPLPRTRAELTANSLTVNGMKLHFGVEVTEELAMSHSLPPKPFDGAFDVRFAGDTKIAEGAAVIDVMNPSSELVIEYSIVKDAGDYMLWVLAADGEEFVLDGMGTVSLPGSVTHMTLNKVPEVPEAFGLEQNFPNPFNPVTTISYQIPEASDVSVSVYNMMGQKVADLVQAHVPAGFHSVVWDSHNLQGEPVSSGVYLYMITAGDFHAMKKMVLMK